MSAYRDPPRPSPSLSSSDEAALRAMRPRRLPLWVTAPLLSIPALVWGAAYLLPLSPVAAAAFAVFALALGVVQARLLRRRLEG